MESLHVHSATEQITTNLAEMELNGNSLPNENDDLSEYTDAEESLSAPIEILAEFLSAVMLKDYEKALQYCKMILEYEPNHSTAKEFYPLIQAKIEQESKLDSRSEDSTTDSENDDSEDSGAVDSSNRTSSHHQSDSDNTSASYSSLEDEEAINSKQRQNNNDFILYNGNSTSTTDSESPTEPSQKLQPRVA